MKKHHLILIVFAALTSCNQSNCRLFDSDAKKFGNEWKRTFEQYTKDNSDKLPAEKLLEGIDSIGKLYFVDKNVILIERYPTCASAVSTLNYIKDKISKEKLQLLLQTIPEEFKADSNYVSIETFLKN
ncbi:hypothetical protein [Myroides fluvii]|uniref:hypothetical protein n=1 Tax=Myroides fluvii TaxID=2572594 RepID=UPI00131AA02C|nr:hypothetical protein [Myroides fluvii]